MTFVIMVAVVGLSWWVQGRIAMRAKADVGEALATVLETTSKAVEHWFREREEETRLWAEHPEVAASCLALARASSPRDHPARATLEERLAGLVRLRGYLGYAVLGPDGRVLAGDEGAGAVPRTVLDHVTASGERTAMSLPCGVDGGADDAPMMASAASIARPDGTVGAALALLIDPERGFTEILQRGRIGRTGESYAFNREARLISESRFDDDLRRIGLVRTGERGILKVQIRDPGGNLLGGHEPSVPRDRQPLTRMARSAVAGESGSDLDGYADYRGVPVVGAWTWNRRYGLGVATEIDREEAYASLRWIRNLAIAGTALTLLLILALTALFLRSRRLMAQASERWTRQILENALDAVVMMDARGAVTYWNPHAEAIFGWSAAEAAGRNMGELIVPETQREKHAQGFQRFIRTREKRISEQRIETTAVHRDGHEFPVELTVLPMRQGDSWTFSAFIRDISVQKKADHLVDRYQSHLEEQVRERTARLARTADELAEAFETIQAQKKRMEDELTVARDIQMAMLPLTFPAFPDHTEFDIWASLQPAREVGGDFYDFFFLDDERFCFCVGDVSDKGVPSALFMAVTKTLLKSRAADDHSTGSILTHLNDELSKNNENCMFVTIFLAILNTRTGAVLFSNAGHNPPYLRCRDGSLTRLADRHGPVIGGLEGLTYEESRLVVQPGDLFVLYSDGITEAMNPHGEMFGEQGLVDTLRNGETGSTEDEVHRLLDRTRAFVGAAEQSDDITVLTLRYNGIPVTGPAAAERVRIANRLSEIRTVQDRFEAFAAQHRVPTRVVRELHTALDELLNNIISYAFPEGGTHTIEVHWDLSGRRLTVTLLDDGVPFNPLSRAEPDTTAPLEGREVGGLGIHIVRNLVDHVTYQRRIGRNALSLLKQVADG